jgi:probable F420-dependent oxidoreductase
MMSFGYVLPNRGTLATPENLRTLAVVAENLDFDSIWVSDHVVIPTAIASQYPYNTTGASPFEADLPYCEPLTTLACLAGATQRIKLGTHVLILPYRNPVLTAKMVATLDYLSGGRVVLGIGAGWMAEEFKALGQPHFAQRGAVTSEYIRLFKELWTKDDPEFHGRFYQVSGIKVSPKPAQKPHPPIWVGGHSDAAIRRAATLGDAWLPIGLRGQAGLEPEEMKRRIAQLRELAAGAGRDPRAVEVCFSTQVAFANGASPGGRRLFMGTPQQIVADLLLYKRMGVRHFVMSFSSPRLGGIIETMERFARDVVPQVASG